uniref:Putative secreted protein n=1 Tax=Anopheles darlingi TaxID=43151 RepID=A0A2M4DA50_ANODA
MQSQVASRAPTSLICWLANHLASCAISEQRIIVILFFPLHSRSRSTLPLIRIQKPSTASDPSSKARY